MQRNSEEGIQSLVGEAGSRLPPYRQLSATLQAQIQQGKFEPGDRLPSVTELVQMYGLSRATVGRGLEDLARTGFIQSRWGSGNFVIAATPHTTQIMIGGRAPREGSRTHGFFNTIVEGVRKGYGDPGRRFLMAFEHPENITAREILEVARVRRADGMVVFHWPEEADSLLADIAAVLPVVLLQRDATRPGIGSVTCDSEQPLRDLLVERVRQGRTQFVYAGCAYGPEDRPLGGFLRPVFEETLVTAGIQPRIVLATQSQDTASPSGGRMAKPARELVELLRDVPDEAVIFSRDPSLARWLREAGHQGEIVSWTEYAGSVAQFQEWLTLIHADIVAAAEASVELLQERDAARRARALRIPATVIERRHA